MTLVDLPCNTNEYNSGNHAEYHVQANKRIKTLETANTLLKPAAFLDIAMARKTAVQTVSSLSLVNDNDLQLPMVANGEYAIEAVLFWIAAATTTGPAVSLNASVAPAYLRFGIVAPLTFGASGAAGTVAVNGASAYNTILLGATTPSATVPAMLQLNGYVTNGASVSSLILRIAGEAAASITYQKGSWMRLTRLA